MVEIVTALAITAAGCLLHEGGHALAARHFGAVIKRLEFSLKGLCLWRSRIPSHRAEILCALSGPAVNLTVALLMFAPGFWFTVGWINLVLGLGNLVLPGADGRRAWHEWQLYKGSLDAEAAEPTSMPPRPQLSSQNALPHTPSIKRAPAKIM
jgi:hypothetical protein